MIENEPEQKIGTDQETVQTYNQSAAVMKTKYENMGARIFDIEKGLELCGKEKPFVAEIGFGSGREAAAMKGLVGEYLGIDVSSAMVEQASETVPEFDFREADVVNFDFPQNVDIVFSFASLLHLPKEQLKEVFKNIARALADDGVLYLSLKHKEEYSDEVVSDEFGTRHFYYYSHNDISELMPESMEEVYYDEQFHAGQDWFTIAFKKLQI